MVWPSSGPAARSNSFCRGSHQTMFSRRRPTVLSPAGPGSGQVTRRYGPACISRACACGWQPDGTRQGSLLDHRTPEQEAGVAAAHRVPRAVGADDQVGRDRGAGRGQDGHVPAIILRDHGDHVRLTEQSHRRNRGWRVPPATLAAGATRCRPGRHVQSRRWLRQPGCPAGQIHVHQAAPTTTHRSAPADVGFHAARWQAGYSAGCHRPPSAGLPFACPSAVRFSLGT